MRFLRRFRLAAAATLPTWGNAPGPAPARVAPAPDGTNLIQHLLDEYGLPWREPRRDVEARVGISPDLLYGRDALFFPDASRPPGFLQPWRADVFERYAPDMPVVRFSALVWCDGSTSGNIERTADHFAGRLGPALVGQECNTLVCRWQSGTASLQLQSWPPAWQDRELGNEAHAREPRLETACHLTLLTGFRLSLSAEEERWVADFQPVAETRPFLRPEPGGLRDTAPTDTEVEYARDPAGYLSQVENRVGCPPGRKALILCTHQLFVLPARDVLAFEVIRLLPAKGGGGSTLLVRCRTTCPGVAYKTLHVAEDGDPNGVTRLGRELATLFDTSCEVGPYFDDV